MSIEKMLQTPQIIVYRSKNNADFIRFLAKRASEYAFHPVLVEFCMQLSGPEEAFKLAKEKIEYRKDPRLGERILSPVYIINLWKNNKKVKGDCDCKVLFLASCLATMGYRVRVVGAMYVKEGSNGINHVYLEYEDNGQWIPLEPSSKRLQFKEKSPNVVPLLRVMLTEPQVKLQVDAYINQMSIQVDEFGDDFHKISEEALWSI